MRTILSLFLGLLITTILNGQSIEVLSSSKYDYFDSNNQLKSSKVYASCLQGDRTLQVEMHLNKNNFITDLKINDKDIAKPRIASYKNITDVILAEVNGDDAPTTEKEITKTKTTVQRPTDPTSNKQLTPEQRKSLMLLIKKQLIADKLLENTEVFDFMLTFDSLYINAKKQPQTIFEQYRDLYNANTDVPIVNGTYFQITQTL